MNLDYTYEGIAYPAHWGGRVERDNPVQLSGRFHTEDFQDGVGILLRKDWGRDLMGWVVFDRADWHKILYKP